MLTRDQHKILRTAPWKSSAELDEFLATVEPEAADIVRLISLVSDKGLSADVSQHRMRCLALRRLAEPVVDPTLFSHFMQALRLPDRQLRNALAPLLAKVAGVARHGQICELFRSNDEELRATAAKILKDVGGKTVLHTLTEMMGEPSFPGRKEAIDLLAPLAGAWAIPALGVALSVGKPLEKRQALRYLADTEFVGSSTTSALDAIRTVLADETDAVSAQAIAAYCSLCTEERYFEEIEPLLDAGRSSVVRAAVLGLKHFPTPRSLLALERKLRQGPTDVRLAVLETLEQIADDRILPPLVEAMRHKNLTVRSRASEILSQLSKSGKLSIARTVIWLLRTGDVDLRRTAADLARSVPDPDGELWPKLVGFLRDEDWWVRERVVDALLELAGPQLSPLLAEYLSDPSDVIRRFAIEVFGRLKDPKTLGLLVRTAGADEDWWVRERAVEAIAAVNDPRGIPYLVNLMVSRPDMQVVCLQALGECRATSAAPQVIELLAADDPDVRLQAVECLGTFDDPTHAPAAEALANDPNPRVRAAAVSLLTRWNVAVRVEVGGSLSALERLLVGCAERQGDDLILASGRPPYVKRLGRVETLSPGVLSADRVEALLIPQLSMAQQEQLKAMKDVDFSLEVAAHRLRFRVNVFAQLGGLSAVFRIIKGTILQLSELGLPEVVKTFPGFRDGLVLVGGPTGSGKSTTLSAIIDHINRTSSRHIISIEDPIEYLHPSRRGLVNQREIGTHTRSGPSALRSTLRQDPDVLLVGEMRDLPTISFAVTAAETGHLVFGTLHTVSVDTTIDRVVNAFPETQQDQVRSMLADSLQAVMCQHLIPRKDGTGRCLATEILLNTDAVSNLIRKGKAYQLPSIVTTSRELGMQSMDSDLKRLYQEGLVSADEVYMRAANRKELEKLEETPPEPKPARPAGPALARQ